MNNAALNLIRNICAELFKDLAKQLHQKQKAEIVLFRFRNLDTSISRKTKFQNQLLLRVLHCSHFLSCMVSAFYKGISHGMQMSVCPASCNIGLIHTVSEHFSYLKKINPILLFSSWKERFEEGWGENE